MVEVTPTHTIVRSRNPKRTIAIDITQFDTPNASTYILSEGRHHIARVIRDADLQNDPERVAEEMDDALDLYIATRPR